MRYTLRGSGVRDHQHNRTLTLKQVLAILNGPYIPPVEVIRVVDDRDAVARVVALLDASEINPVKVEHTVRVLRELL